MRELGLPARVWTSDVLLPPGGDDLGSLLLVGDGEGADGRAVPECFGLAFGVVDGVGGGVDVDAGQVVAVDLVEDPGGEGEGVGTEAVED